MTPTVTEPEVVTLAKMSDHLAERAAETERALTEADAEIARTAFEAERGGGDDALRKLASAEKRRDKLVAELERLHMAAQELERQLTDERERAEARERLALVRQYIEHRDAVDKANAAMMAAIEGLVPLAAEANEHGQVAAQIGLRLGFHDERGRLGVKPGYVKTAMRGVTENVHGSERLLHEAREGLLRDWRVTANGKRAMELQAALSGDGKAG
jgi:hypothetical protein